MRQQPDKVLECPRCKTPVIIFMRISGNTIDSDRWTDGKIEPLWPVVIKCSECGNYFWRSATKEIGEIPFWGPEQDNIPESWKAVPRAKDLTEAEYLEAIRSGSAITREQHLDLRFGAWWAGNDLFRHNTGKPVAQMQIERSVEARLNLETLCDLLNIEDPNQRLLKAEAMRELGHFKEAILLLEKEFPAYFKSPAALVQTLAENQDPIVREIEE